MLEKQYLLFSLNLLGNMSRLYHIKAIKALVDEMENLSLFSDIYSILLIHRYSLIYVY